MYSCDNRECTSDDIFVPLETIANWARQYTEVTGNYSGVYALRVLYYHIKPGAFDDTLLCHRCRPEETFPY